jgi:hypothetical protein
MSSKNEWSFLGLYWSRVGYVESLDFIGYNLYYRCGSLVKLFGVEWIQK